MPQHPARHDAPAHQPHALANPQVKREIAGDTHRLADLHGGAGPRMRVAKLSITASPQSLHRMRSADRPSRPLERELRLELEPGRRANPRVVELEPLLEDDALAALAHPGVPKRRRVLGHGDEADAERGRLEQI